MSTDYKHASDAVSANSADVIIVGCGPVHFDDHIMRVFQTLGVAEELDAVTRYNPGMRFVDPQNNLLLDWPRPPGIGENGWYSSYRFHQPDLEKILRDKISSCKLIELKTGVSVTKVEQASGYATVYGQSEQGETTECYRARYAVGCDGAQSIIRTGIGHEVEDFGFNEHWLVIDALLKHDKPELGDYTIQHCGRHRSATYVRCPGRRRRWEVALMPNESRADFEEEKVLWELLSYWVTPDDADIERSAVYEFKSQVSRQWRNGRLLIAGDAAHLTPPFMGQGMCAGIRDASNLAWKLAKCCMEEARLPVASRGDSSLKINRLLESYQDERIPNVIKMKSIVPRLGTGLGSNLNGEVCGQWFQQPRLHSKKLFDDVVAYKPALIIEPALWLLWPDNKPLPFTVLVTEQSCLDAYDVSALIVRPDRYILGGAGNIKELEALICLACDFE